jgi:hypothetical protein
LTLLGLALRMTFTLNRLPSRHCHPTRRLLSMKSMLTLAALALLLTGSALQAGGITGQYIEARTCDVWTGPCFANAEMNLGGKHAVLGWKIDKGTLNDVTLDGLGVVAVVAASDTLGLEQTGKARALLIVDQKATTAQRDALVQLARKQGGELLRNVVGVESAAIDLVLCPCTDGGCANLKAGPAVIETRCVDHKHDKICGNESAFYPPLAQNVSVKPAIAVEHRFSGKGVKETWSDAGRRGAYLGTFEIR